MPRNEMNRRRRPARVRLALEPLETPCLDGSLQAGDVLIVQFASLSLNDDYTGAGNILPNTSPLDIDFTHDDYFVKLKATRFAIVTSV